MRVRLRVHRAVPAVSRSHPRGTSNTNTRGGTPARRARKRWLLATFDVDLGPETARCALRCHQDCHGTVTYETMQVDRKVSQLHGGTYRRENIQPSCPPCNHQKGTQEREAEHARACQGTCSRCRRAAALSMNYRVAREAAELEREAVTAGYATESGQYGALITLRDYLEQTRGEG